MSALAFLAGAAAVLAAASGSATADVPHGEVMAAGLSAPWVACTDAAHVAYRAVPARLNTHNAFTQPIRVRLAAGQTCSNLR